jgi:serine/threonine-protein kinase
MPADGSGHARRVSAGEVRVGNSPAWLPSGDGLLYGSLLDDIWLASIDPGKAPVQVTNTPARERSPAVSPDGRFLAYASSESGTQEVYVQPFPSGSGKWVVSNKGGNRPKWSSKGDELFFFRDFALMSVRFEPGPSFRVTRVEKLFDSQLRVWEVAGYEPMPGGQSFLSVGFGSASRGGVVVTENWLQEFRRKHPSVSP